MWLNMEVGAGDFLVNAAHEAQHLMGRLHSKDDGVINKADEDAYNQLSPSDQATAPQNADNLYRRTEGRSGKPMPKDVTESTKDPYPQ